MKTTYSNRFGDEITFTEIDEKTVEMSGFLEGPIRVGHANDFSEAYDIYLLQCKALEEPDNTLLVDDPANNCTRPMTFQEFAQHMQDILYKKDHPSNAYWKYVTVDKNRCCMVDPSGGPYVALGTNVGRYFEDQTTRIVKDITLEETKIILKIKKHSK